MRWVASKGKVTMTIPQIGSQRNRALGSELERMNGGQNDGAERKKSGGGHGET